MGTLLELFMGPACMGPCWSFSFNLLWPLALLGEQVGYMGNHILDVV